MRFCNIVIFLTYHFKFQNFSSKFLGSGVVISCQMYNLTFTIHFIDKKTLSRKVFWMGSILLKKQTF